MTEFRNAMIRAVSSESLGVESNRDEASELNPQPRPKIILTTR